MEAQTDTDGNSFGLCDILVDQGESPLEACAHEEVRARVEQELQQVPEPYRTTVVLRDIEGLSYEEIAEILQISLGTVKSRLIRGRDALKKRLEIFVQQMKSEAPYSAAQGAAPQASTSSPGQAGLEKQS